MKKLIFSIAVVAGLITSLVGLCSFSSDITNELIVTPKVHTHTHAASEGKRCNGSVGCDCPGFAPITTGEEWEKGYCRYCKHKKFYH